MAKAESLVGLDVHATTIVATVLDAETGQLQTFSMDGEVASAAGREETAIGLGQPALQSLGVAQYERRRDARRALDRGIIAVDPAYELVGCERRSGWCLVIRRLSGARA